MNENKMNRKEIRGGKRERETKYENRFFEFKPEFSHIICMLISVLLIEMKRLAETSLG